MPAANSYSVADITVLDTHCTPIKKQPEALLCIVGLSRRYFMGDDLYPTFLYDDDRYRLVQLDQCPKSHQGNASTTGVALEEVVAAMGPPVNKRHRKKGNNEAEVNASPKVLRRDHNAFRPTQSTHRGKSLALMGLDEGSLLSTPAVHDPSTTTKSVSDPEPMSYVKPQPHPKQDIVQSFMGTATEIPTKDVATAEVNIQFSVGSLESRRSTSVPSVVESPGEVRLLKKARSKIARRDQRIQNLKTLLDAEVDMKKAAEAKNAKLAKELDSLRVQFLNLQVSNSRLSEKVLNLQAQVIELYPYMLTAIAGRRWVIGHGLCLAVMKCVESSEIRQAFADVVSARLAKGMSEGLKYDIEHGKAERDLVDVIRVLNL
ncbi:hypothetical protein Tco_0214781 [Tanacetum coccineum]